MIDVIRIVLTIILPPIGVLLRVGASVHLLINVLLTLLGYIPGLVHAIWLFEKTAAGEIPANRSAFSDGRW